MEPTFFKKMHGSGNDFILIDNRSGVIGLKEGPELARRLCRRKFSVGADGLILIEGSETADFRWRFYNADGSEAEMCGNGGRCAARFAVMSGIAPSRLTFETGAGLIRAEVEGRVVKLELPTPKDLQAEVAVVVEGQTLFVDSLNTGVPHVVVFTEDLEGAPVVPWGRLIRNAPVFQPAGTNVNFVRVLDRSHIAIRTYERGVEDETLACGTGSVASAILSAARGFTQSPVRVRTWGGEELTVYFELAENGISGVFLQGEAVSVYSAQFDEEA